MNVTKVVSALKQILMESELKEIKSLSDLFCESAYTIQSPLYAMSRKHAVFGKVLTEQTALCL